MEHLKNFKINSATMKCIRKTYNVQTVGDMVELGIFLKLNDTENNSHKACKNCACKTCKTLRRKECGNPHKYSKTACTFWMKL